MDPDMTTIDGDSSKQDIVKIPFPVVETSHADLVRERISRGHVVSQDELDNALISACQCGHKVHVCYLVEHGANIEKKDTNGNTPLLICAENGFTHIADFLVTCGANISAQNSFGNNALILSIDPARSLTMVKLILEQRRRYINHPNKDGDTALMKAVEVKEIQLIRLLLDAWGNTGDSLFRAKNCRNETAQVIADRVGIGNVVRLLLKHKNDIVAALLAAIQECDVGSFSILIDCLCSDTQEKTAAIKKMFEEMFISHKRKKQMFNENEVEILKRLLQCGADPNNKHHGFDPLLISIEVGSYSVLQLLCEHGASLCSHGICKDYLDIAAENGRTDLLEVLLKYQVKIKESSLNLALRHGHTDCAKLLIKHGAIMDIKHAFTTAVMQQLPVYLKCLLENFRYEIRKFASTKDMRDLLVMAAEGGNLEIIGLVLDAGAYVNCANNHGKTPLMEAKNAEVVHFLVQRGAVVNKCRRYNIETSSPLTYILSCNRFVCNLDRRDSIIQALLEHGASVNGKSCGGRTALLIAASKKGSKNIIQKFLERGADVNVYDNKCNTAFLLAAQENLTDNLISLLQYNKGPNTVLDLQNYNGMTALMIASQKCNHLAMKALIDHGADVNITDFKGNTAFLHVLTGVCDPKEEILRTLVNAGSDINIQNNDGFSPLMLAAKNYMIDSIKLLVKLGVDINAVSKNSSTGSALSVLLTNASLGQKAQVCLDYLLDQGARASYVNPNVLHRLIHHRELTFIPKLIQNGLGPADVRAQELPASVFTAQVVPVVSPLCMALLTGNASLARYFVGNLFLTSSDFSSLTTNKDVRLALENKHQECLDLLDEMSTQVISLFKLSFVAVLSAVGPTPGREERVSMLPLPQVIKDRLLFKTEDIHLDVTASNRPITAQRSSFIDRLNLLTLIRDISLGHYDYDSNYDYDSIYDYDYDPYDSDW